MRVPREAWWVVALTFVMSLLILLLTGGELGQRGPSVLPSRTTYSAEPEGLRALYLTLRELGYDARRLRAPSLSPTLPASAGSLIIVEPLTPLAKAEAKALHGWVAAGHALLLVGESGLPARENVSPTFAKLDEGGRLSSARPITPSYLARGVERLAVRSGWRLPPTGDVSVGQSASWRTATSEAGVHSQGPSEGLARDARQAAPLFRDRGGTVVSYARVGRGTLVLLASPWSLSNAGIGREDNLQFVLNALGPPGERPVYFDEYHHGYGENVLWRLIPLPLKLAGAQLLLAALVVMYARSRRLGAVIPLERGRRARSEFLGTMTALLHKGRATRLAVRTAYDAAMDRLRLELGLAAEAGPEDAAEAAARLNPEAGKRLGEALRQCRRLLEGRDDVGEAQAIAVVQQLDRVMRLVREV